MALFGPPDVGKLAAKGDIKGLIKALASRDTRKGESVWAAALAALVEIGTPAVAPLLAVLDDDRMSAIAMRALGEIGDVRAVEPLIAALPTLDAVDALGRIGDPRALEPLAAAFASTSGLVRHNAGHALARIGGDQAMELLLTVALSDPNQETRQAAVSALATMGKRPVEHFISALGDERPAVRVAAAAALGEIGGKRSIDALVAAVADREPSMREAAARALKKQQWQPTADAVGASFLISIGECPKCVEIGAPAVEPLIAALSNTREWSSALAAEALGELGDIRAVEPLIAALVDEDGDPHDELLRDELWSHAATALGKLRDPRALEPLIALLHDQDGQLRRAAAQALGEIRDVRDARPLVAALADCAAGGGRDAFVRDGIIGALGKIGEPAIELLLAAVATGGAAERASAADALDQLGWQPRPDAAGAAYWIAKADWERCVEIGAAAVEPLIAALGDDREPARKGAAGALGEIGDSRALAPLATMLGDESDDARWVAVKALARLGAPAVEPLVGALGDEASSVRVAAAGALREIGEPAVEALVGTLAWESGRAREAACKALGDTADARALKPLATALEDGDEDVRTAAAGALGKLGGEALEPLARALGDVSASVREAAAAALGRIGDARALAPLLAALEDEISQVRVSAATALGATGDEGAIQRLIDTLGDPAVAVRQAAALALEALGWTPGRDAAAATYWIVKSDWERCSEIGSPALGPLVWALADEREPARRSAVAALGKFADPGAVDVLVGALSDRSEGVRLTAAASLDALGWRPAPDAVGAAYCVVKHEWAWCVDIGPAALTPLIAALKDPAWPVRKAAAESLLAIHRSGALGEEQKALLLAQRQDITRWHVDKRDSFVSSSDCGGHSDKHTDEGIGVNFPL